MGSGNWFGNIISSLIATLIFSLIYAFGSILGIFGAWDVTHDMALQTLEQWALPAMTTIYKGNMKVGN